MNHTPGPWAVHPSKAQVDCFTPEPQPICQMLWPTDMRSEEETEANARLIAAAPELLAACKALIDAPHQEHFAARLNDEEMAGIDAIKAVLAKLEEPWDA